MQTIQISTAEAQNADTYNVGDILVYWVANDRQSSVYLGRGADKAAAMRNAAETIVDIDFDAAGGALEPMRIVADEDERRQPYWIIEAADANDQWGELESRSDVNVFFSRDEAEAAIVELSKLDGWDRDSLRARYVPV